jgi:hypothetical protein
MAKRRATKSTARKTTSKRAPAKKSAAKKASKSTAKKRAPAKPAKKTAATKRAAPPKKGAARKPHTRPRKKRSPKRPPPTAYEKRDKNAKAKGYESYWDERTSRVRARTALADIGHPTPNATDPATLREVDELATLGRGESARELYYKTKRILERYQPAPTDRQIWSLIRIFYKPKSRR